MRQAKLIDVSRDRKCSLTFAYYIVCSSCGKTNYHDLIEISTGPTDDDLPLTFINEDNQILCPKCAGQEDEDEEWSDD